jgi:RNA polymerase sigma-70 factor (ECF subfamily)
MTLPSSPHPADLSSLLFRPGDAAAPDWWPRFDRLYRPVVRSWVLNAGLQPIDAEDLIQQVWLDVHRGIASFRREGGSFSAWLATITRRRVSDFYRRQGRQGEAVGGSDFLSVLGNVPAPTDHSSLSLPPSDIPSPHLRRAMNSVRGEFEQKTWRAFWLVVVEEKTTDEAARQLDMTSGAVRVAKSKVLKRLRQEVGWEEGGGERS